MAFVSRAGRSMLLLILLAPAWTSGCGGDKSTPTTPTPATTTTTPAPAPSSNSVTRVTIAGNVTLSAIGDTSQLTATATFSDNSTKDVTTGGVWQVSDSRVITVSPGGLLAIRN